MQTAAFGFTLYSVFSISENLIQFPFHGARLGKFQRIRLTDMVGSDAVILCKTQNVADGNAVDDLGRRKPNRPAGQRYAPAGRCRPGKPAASSRCGKGA